MNRLRALWNFVTDSPTFDRDRTNLLTGAFIGIASLVLNGIVIAFSLPVLFSLLEYGGDVPILERIGLGQLLAILLLSGATAVATILVPLRLCFVLWGPRMGRYFDQIVLTGISPLRFLIGKAVSQYFLLGLLLFLLLPYFVLSLTLGGVRFHFVITGIILIWVYCMELALLTLWLSLYVNEMIAAFVIVTIAIPVSVWGCYPLPIQPFLMTPFPALAEPFQEAILAVNRGGSLALSGSLATALRCLLCMSGLALVALCGIAFGPLFGIIRDNSTFGEVVSVGDTKKRRRIRYLSHIQRPSELAFFYQNRTDPFQGFEGLWRWGTKLVLLTCLSLIATAALFHFAERELQVAGNSTSIVPTFHSTYLGIYATGVILAAVAFSHSKNTTYLRISLWPGRRVQVSRLDTWTFAAFFLFATCLSIATPFYFERHVAPIHSATIFPTGSHPLAVANINYYRCAIEGSMIVLVAGVTVYTLQRLLCQRCWFRTQASGGSYGAYCVICLIPAGLSAFCTLAHDYDPKLDLSRWESSLKMASPTFAWQFLHQDQTHEYLGQQATLPFYMYHAAVLAWLVWQLRRSGLRLRKSYLPVSLGLGLALTPTLSTNAWCQPPSTMSIDTRGVIVEVQTGWDGMIDRATPVPLSLLIRNHLEQPLEGRLTLLDPIRGVEIKLGDVYVSPGATQQFSAIHDLSDWNSGVAILSNQGQMLWRREIALDTASPYSPRDRYVLYIDPQGKHLPEYHPREETPQPDSIPSEIVDVVRYLSATPWQVPTHAAPLMSMRAILIDGKISVGDLNRAQYEALANWVCQGGSLILSHQSPEVRERLLQLAPLDAASPEEKNGIAIYRLGLGTIRVHSYAESNDNRAAFADQIAQLALTLPDFPIPSSMQIRAARNEELGRSEMNLLLLGAFLGGYTLLSGLISLAFFRTSQRWMSTYITSVVILACGCAAVLGGILRMSPGDLEWVTVTRSTDGGLIQQGAIRLKSAGNVHGRIGVTGAHADLLCFNDLIFTPQRGALDRLGMAPFDGRSSLPVGESEAYRLNVSMVAWGRRDLLATAFNRSPSSTIAFQMQIVAGTKQEGSDEEPSAGDSEILPPEIISIQIQNRLPIELVDSWVIVRRELDPKQMDSIRRRGRSRYFAPNRLPLMLDENGNPNWRVRRGMIDVSPSGHGTQLLVYRIPSIAAGASVERQFRNGDQISLANLPIPYAPIIAPPTDAKNTAILLAKVPASPIVGIDPAYTDFNVTSEMHLILQPASDTGN